MKVLTIILAFFALIGGNIANWIQDLDLFCYLKNCQYYESSTEGEIYLDSFKLKDIEASQISGYLAKFEFYAVAPKNVHVYFAPKPYSSFRPDDQFYEIEIGSDQIDIRNRNINNLGSIKRTNTPKVLNPYLPNHILVSIRDDGGITVRVNNKTVAAAVYSNPLKLAYFGFRNWDSTRVQFYYDCKNRTVDAVQNNVTEYTASTKKPNTV